MRKEHILFFFVIFSFIPPLTSQASTVAVEVIHSRDRYETDSSYPLLFQLRIQDPWYIHGTTGEDDGMIPTSLSFLKQGSLTIDRILFPRPELKKFQYTSGVIEVYSGDVFVEARLSVGRDVPTKQFEIKGMLTYQACSGSLCLPPEEMPVSFLLNIAEPGTPFMILNRESFQSSPANGSPPPVFHGIKPNAGLWLTLLLIFLQGLLLNLTPCIYPLIPITVSYFGGRGYNIGTSALFHGSLYLAGLAITNSILGVTSALTGNILGSILQNPLVLILVAAIILAMGFSFFGFWELKVPMTLNRLASKNFKGYFGTFFMGLTLGIIAAPCLGPFLLGLIIYVGHLGDPFLGFLYFFILSIGIGIPLAVLGIFSGIVQKLPGSGDWMLWVRRFMGWVLVGMAVYIVSPLIPYQSVRSGSYLILAISAGIHLGWIDKTGKGLPFFYHLKKGVAILIILLGLIYMVSSLHEKEGVQWIPFSQDVLNDASREGKIAVIDCYADWCLPCKELDRAVFSNDGIIQLSSNAVMVRLDLTRSEPFQQEVIRRYKITGVPTIIFINKKGIEERDLRIESLVDADDFKDRFEKLLKR